jgi:hypothetical protein
MSTPAVQDSIVLKRDTLFQLQRVFTRGGRRLLVKFAVADWRGVEDTLLESEFRIFELLGGERVLQPIALETGDKLSARY